MTEKQREAFRALIKGIKVSEFHSGDCVGADKQAFNDVYLLHPNVWMDVHPPNSNKLRAFCKVRPNSGNIRPTRMPLDRNHQIVKATQLLIAAPEQKYEILQSGTWATVRYARKLRKPVVIILPDGEFTLKKQ